MSTRRLTARGAASPELAWERYDRIALWPTWSPQISGVETDAERIAVGVRGTVRALGGLGVAFTVLAVDHAARRWSWAVRLGPVSMTLHHEVHADQDGSGTSMLMEGLAPVVLAYAPVAWFALRRLVSR